MICCYLRASVFICGSTQQNAAGGYGPQMNTDEHRSIQNADECKSDRPLDGQSLSDQHPPFLSVCICG